MGLISWLKSRRAEKEKTINTIESFPISRTETPDKIIETRIRPVKIPTIVDIGERLGMVSNNLMELKDEIVTKSWFRSEYQDTGSEVISRLVNIENELKNINNYLIQMNNGLSNFTDSFTKVKLSKPSDKTFGTSDLILVLLKDKKRMRYKDFISEVNVSDPTLSKHLKNLVDTDKIKRTKAGKAVYYELN